MNEKKKVAKKVVPKKVKKASKKVAAKVAKKASKKVATKVVKKAVKKVAKKILKKVIKKSVKKNISKTKTLDTKTNIQDDYMVLMQRDPNWLHAFWNVDEKRREKALKQNKKLVLKLYDVSRDITVQQSKVEVKDDAHRIIELPSDARSWYIENDIKNSSSTRAELGAIDKKGDYTPLVESNVSENNKGFNEAYEQWQSGVDAFVSESLGSQEVWDFWSSGEAMRKFSKDKKNPLEKFPLGPTSGPLSSGEFMNQSGLGLSANEDSKDKDFFFWVKTRLIVYGGTKPDAKLTVRDEPYELNEDGTFNFEMDLPDSTQVIPIRAVGAENENGDQDETITPVVLKRTE